MSLEREAASGEMVQAFILVAVPTRNFGLSMVGLRRQETLSACGFCRGWP